MTYYIVVNEWQYPTETGRDIMGDFDTLEEAKQVAAQQVEEERDNFLLVNNGDIYEEACGEIVDERFETIGFDLNSSQYEEENMFFRSMIIKREV